jgi:dimethylhistidine N-methyltransferase
MTERSSNATALADGEPDRRDRPMALVEPTAHGNDVLAGLRASPKTLPCRLLWDTRGAELFTQICTLDEYYLTRHELGILRERLPAIAAAVGPGARVIEPGSGVAHKTRLLLDALVQPASYVPIELEAAQLAASTAVLRAAYPELDVEAVCADYTSAFELPGSRRPFGRSLVFFPGSTIGNFELAEAQAFLARFAAQLEPGAMLVLGADSNSDGAALVRAYDDAQGVTAEFDRNVLVHLNREYGADFDCAAYTHRAVWDPERSRIEMHLVSVRDQMVRLGGETIALRRDEPIVTEHCYKYSPAALASLLERAGWRVDDVFPDARGWMRLWMCTRA